MGVALRSNRSVTIIIESRKGPGDHDRDMPVWECLEDGPSQSKFGHACIIWNLCLKSRHTFWMPKSRHLCNPDL